MSVKGSSAKPQHVNPGIDATIDPTFHQDTYRQLPSPNFNEEIAVEFSRDIYEEMARASSKFPSFASEHEGWAILMEEVDELWEAVRMHQSNPHRHKLCEKECIQVGAMALRFLHDMKLREQRRDNPASA
jgi:hypothetical protein